MKIVSLDSHIFPSPYLNSKQSMQDDVRILGAMIGAIMYLLLNRWLDSGKGLRCVLLLMDRISTLHALIGSCCANTCAIVGVYIPTIRIPLLKMG